jgi:hypothetical protein
VVAKTGFLPCRCAEAQNLLRGTLPFRHCPNEADAFPWQCFDQALIFTIVTDCGPSGI